MVSTPPDHHTQRRVADGATTSYIEGPGCGCQVPQVPVHAYLGSSSQQAVGAALLASIEQGPGVVGAFYARPVPAVLTHGQPRSSPAPPHPYCSWSSPIGADMGHKQPGERQRLWADVLRQG